MKVYIAVLAAENNPFTLIGPFNSLNEAEKARTPDDKIANHIYECTVGRSNEWRLIRNQNAKQWKDMK